MIFGLSQKTILIIFVTLLLVCLIIAEIIMWTGQRNLNRVYKKYGLKRDTYFFDVLTISFLIILLIFYFRYLFKDYIHIPLDVIKYIF